MDEQTNGETDEPTNGQMDKWTYNANSRVASQLKRSKKKPYKQYRQFPER